MEVLIIRHGQCLGQCEPPDPSPDSVLSLLGEQQAHQTAHRLRSAGITHILSSPLVRALATASIVATLVGDKPIQVWHDLREMWDAAYRGVGRRELQRRFPRALLPTTMPDDGWEYGGDTHARMVVRSTHVWEQLTAHFGPDDRVVVVTHGFFANYLLHAILQVPSSTLHWFAMHPCAITWVRVVPEQQRVSYPDYPVVDIEVLSMNDVSHLGR